MLPLRCYWWTAADRDCPVAQLSARAVFVIGPDKKLKLSILYPATTGRNFREVWQQPGDS